MWTRPSISCGVFLIAVVTLTCLSASTEGQWNSLPCCDRSSRKRMTEPILRCYRQNPRVNCNYSAYLIVTSSGRQHCVKEATKWLKKKIREGELTCPSAVQISGFLFHRPNKANLVR